MEIDGGMDGWRAMHNRPIHYQPVTGETGGNVPSYRYVKSEANVAALLIPPEMEGGEGLC